MKILLISANREVKPDPVPPIGLAYLSRVLDLQGYVTDILDLCFKGDISNSIRGKIEAFEPDAIGISIRNIDDTIYPRGRSYLSEIEEISCLVRKWFNGPVILGGAGFSLFPEALMKRTGVDLGIVGEGEITFPLLLKSIFKNEEIGTIPGTLRRMPNGKIERVPVEPSWELSGIDTKGWDKIDITSYYHRGGMISIQTKRGCQSSCLYCTYPAIEGSRIRLRPPSDVVDEIEEWKEGKGITHFFFVDSVFNFPLDHCRAILAEISERRLNVRWTAYINPRFLTPELVRLMGTSGCMGVELGVDSGSNRILRSLRKDFLSHEVVRAISLLHENRIPCCASLILGGPGEDPKSLDESFDLMDSCKVDAVIAMVGMRVYPGCRLYDICLHEGRIDAGDMLLEPFFYISSGIEEREIARIFYEAQKRGNWILPGWGINYNGDVFRRLRFREVKVPLWRLLKKR